MIRVWASICALLITIGGQTTAVQGSPQELAWDAQHDRALTELRQALQAESRWVKVHAAEALLALGYPQDVPSTFARELDERGDEPQYRVGIWRVLARTATDEPQHRAWLESIRGAALANGGIDQVHALEALAKLRYSLSSADRPGIEQIADGNRASASAYARWLLTAQTPSDPTAVDKLAQLLDSEDSVVRGLTAYGLRQIPGKLPADVAAKLNRLAQQSSGGDRAYLVSAAFLSDSNPESSQRFKSLLVEIAQTGGTAEKRELCAALAEKGDDSDSPLLTELLADSEPDVRVAAADALLRVERRRPATISMLDWAVVAIYALVMLLVGWSYSGVKNVEDYLLGGRKMKPWAVGVSLFATLMSTLTYLAYPGEMIRHGPLILGGILSYPLVYLVVGRLMIPSIMRLRITSAYEILERRFGLSVRMLGSAIFLVLRLLWMALIVYATSDAVLVPLLHLERSATPWVCMVLAAITVVYTSMGGLQAVVFIDVLQTFIMLFGALLALLLISINLGGITAWWPSHWSAAWDTPRLWFSGDARVSLAMAILSSFTWYLCTASSDQIAVQRYLATRDASAARRMFGVSLICDASVAIILAALGLALFAYFSSHPQMLPDGESISSSADKLLLQYIVRALPAGVTGLMVAGILSAAMDSLSSGLNSATSVIVADWLGRFRLEARTGDSAVRQAKLVSWLIGIVVTGLSLLTIYVPGNLLELCYRVVNLLVAPLAVLFFLAMFVPWATTLGSWSAAIGSTIVALRIAFYRDFGLSFLWIMPASLAAGLVVGSMVSLLPIGRRRPMLESSQV